MLMAPSLIMDALRVETRRRFRRPFVLPVTIVAGILTLILRLLLSGDDDWEAPTPGRFLLLPLATATAWLCVSYLWFTPGESRLSPATESREQRTGRRLALVPGAAACFMGACFAALAVLYLVMAPVTSTLP